MIGFKMSNAEKCSVQFQIKFKNDNLQTIHELNIFVESQINCKSSEFIPDWPLRNALHYKVKRKKCG